LRKSGEDPFGDESSDEISKKALDAILVGDDTEASAVVHSAIEEFAQELAYVTRRFLKTKAWAKIERIVVGGGFRESRLGERAIARTGIILKSEDFKIDMVPIRFHPDDAGLLARCILRLVDFRAHDGVLASISAAPISAAAWWRRAGRSARPLQGDGVEIGFVAPCR